MNLDEYIYIAVFLLAIALALGSVWWVVSRAYYYVKFGSLDPIFREKD